MAKREKKVIITGVTREAADEAFAVYAKADAQSAKITADIELQCAKIREKYANKLAELEGEKERPSTPYRPTPPRTRLNCSPRRRASRWRTA